jgi:hypothetical protein
VKKKEHKNIIIEEVEGSSKMLVKASKQVRISYDPPHEKKETHTIYIFVLKKQVIPTKN